MCFDGFYRNKADKNVEDTNNNLDADIFDIIANALRMGLTYQDLSNMNFVMLSNIADAMAPKKHKPTQEEINLIT